MPLTRFAADAFGVLTISLVVLFAIFGLLCIYQATYLRVQIQRRSFLQLCYFNGPWITRIALILVAIWWGLGEIARLSFLKGKVFSSITWQRNICKIYILSSLGFSEPCILLTLVFLLRASMQNRETGALSQRWNRKTIGCIFLLCLPVLFLQTLLVFAGPDILNKEKSNKRAKMAKYFTRTSYSIEDNIICTYPLFSTILIGLFDALLISYVSYVGMRVLSLVINKRLRQRLYWLIFSVVFLVPSRLLLLGFSVMPQPGILAYELLVFMAFLFMLSCILIGIVEVVYFPVADSMALRDLGIREIEEVPYDDYYYDSASLIANQSRQELSSDASTKRGSISFRTMIREDNPGSDGLEEAGSSSHGTFHIGSPPGSSPARARSMLPLREIPRY